MREIKFRAWHKKYKLMIYIPTMNEFSDGIIYPSCYDIRDCILMQYTGLKDKNGKEIYEGDILDNEEKVKYINGGFDPFCVAGWECTTEWEKIIVIGNIYENSELLK